ncbi:MAG: hypothetical protein AMS18_02770, partial [Gemmatimonas sp. SG8_17]
MEHENTMKKIHRYRAGIFQVVAAALVVLLGFAFWGCAEGEFPEQTSRADIIVIDSMSAFGSLDRPPVVFPHDQHTEALAELGEDCETCHITMENGRLASRFMRLDDEDKDLVMETYHTNCVACHQTAVEEGRDSGPTICGDCHRVEPLSVSSRVPMGFDRSLHDRHGERLGYECDLCHHEYD